MKYIFYIATIISLFAFSKCAQQTNPSGGERDLYPPILDTNKTANSIPENFSTNFQSSEITLHFNEFFTLNNPDKQIIITPIPKEKPSFSIRGKKLVITLGGELKENTTYTINFGNSIKDITEGNTVKNFTYVFSTGVFIDSLMYSGVVYDAVTKKGVNEATVMLYENINDSLPFTGIPVYFTKTNTTGHFTMNYLKAGEYKAVAVLDENNNYRYNPKSESIAFANQLISIPKAVTDTSENIFILFKEDTEKQFIAEKKYTPLGKINLKLNKTSERLNIAGLTDFELNPEWVYYSKNKDSIEIWIDSNWVNEKTISIAIIDETNKFSDTIKIPLVKQEKLSKSPLTFNHNAKKGLDIGKNLALKFNKPLSQFDTSKIEIIRNDEIVPFECIPKNTKEISLNAKWKENAKYTIIIYPNAFIDLYGTSTDTIKSSFRYKAENDYGNLFFNLNTEEQENYILQLLQNNLVVVETNFKGNSFKHTFNQLNPGNYDFKLIYDHNKNGKWDTGDYLKGLQPERVEFYNKEISIRSGWDLDVTWEIK